MSKRELEEAALEVAKLQLQQQLAHRYDEQLIDAVMRHHRLTRQEAIDELRLWGGI